MDKDRGGIRGLRSEDVHEQGQSNNGNPYSQSDKGQGKQWRATIGN